MLEINLQQIIDDINKRRNRVRYQFQEIALMLAEKLKDPKHKSLYMKLAKNEEQELLMDAMNHVLASQNVSGNLGALFMWKLKDLKATPLEPLILRFDVAGGYFVIGSITHVTRGDMPLLAAALTTYQEEQPTEVTPLVLIKKQGTSIIGSQEQSFPSLKTSVDTMLKDFKRTAVILLYSTWQFRGEWAQSITNTPIPLKGVLKLGTPVLTKKPFRSKIHSS